MALLASDDLRDTDDSTLIKRVRELHAGTLAERAQSILEKQGITKRRVDQDPAAVVRTAGPVFYVFNPVGHQPGIRLSNSQRRQVLERLGPFGVWRESDGGRSGHEIDSR